MEPINVLLLGGWQDSASVILKYFKSDRRYRFYVADRWKYNAARFSRHCAGFFLLPDFSDNETDYIAELIKHYRANQMDVLLPIPQDEMVLVSRHKDTLLKEGLRFLVPDYEVMDIAVDKSKLGTHLAKHDIPYPKTYCATDYPGCDILEKEGLPLITKLRRGTGQHDQRISWEKDGFLRHLEKVTAYYGKEEIIVQKFIPGLETEAMYTVGVLNNRHAETITIVPTKKIRARPYTGGSGVCVKTLVDSEVKDICGRAARSFGAWAGIMDIEVKRDIMTGKVYLIEINPRPWGIPMLAVLLSGVNIIELWIKASLGEEIEAQDGYREGVYSLDVLADYLLFMDIIKDLFASKRQAALTTLKSYRIPYFTNTKDGGLLSCSDVDLLDPFPFLFKLFRLRKSLLYSILPTSLGRRDR